MPIHPPTNSRCAFQGRIFDVWQWEQKLFDGTSETFECITRPDTVTAIPFLDAHTVLLTKQTQPHKAETFLDFPGGRVNRGEGFGNAVRRELQEETGYQAERWFEWHRLANRGLNHFEEGLFIATQLHDGYGAHCDAGEKIELLPTKWSDLVELCLKGQLRQPGAMLVILAIEFDPEARERLRGWLSEKV